MMLRRLKVLLPVVLSTLAAYAACVAYTAWCPYAIGWNTTSSIPPGLYWAKDYKSTPLSRGDLVCVVWPAPAWAANRGYVAPGQRICKPVVGLPGDTISVEKGVLTVTAVEGSAKTYKLLSTDSHGRALPQDALSNGLIPAGQFLLASDYKPNSLDSRYLGLIAASAIRNQIWPLWTE